MPGAEATRSERPPGAPTIRRLARPAKAHIECAVDSRARLLEPERKRSAGAFEMRQKMDLGLFRHPVRELHRLDQFDGAGREWRRVGGAFAALVSVPARGGHATNDCRRS